MSLVFLLLLRANGLGGCLICADTGNQRPSYPTRKPTVAQPFDSARLCFDLESGKAGQSKDPWAGSFWVFLGWSGDDDKQEDTECHVCAQLIDGVNGRSYPEICREDGMVNNLEDGTVYMTAPAMAGEPYPNDRICIDLQPNYVIGKYQVMVRVKNCPGRESGGDWLGDPMWVDRFTLYDADRTSKHFGSNDRKGWCMSPVANAWKGEQECTGSKCTPLDSEDEVLVDWEDQRKQKVIGKECHKVLVLNNASHLPQKSDEVTPGWPEDVCEWEMFEGKKSPGYADRGYAGGLQGATVYQYTSRTMAQAACFDLPACEAVTCTKQNSECILRRSWDLEDTKDTVWTYRPACGGLRRRLQKAISS